MEKILAIDCNAVGWGVFHALPPLSHNEQGTAIIYGFLNTLFELQRFEQADHIVFAWDSRQSNREKLFPAYKAKRKKKYEEHTEEEVIAHSDRAQQFYLLRTSILPELGFKNILHEEGFEGDDLIASIVKTYGDTHMIRIVGRDNDLYQLIGANCNIFDNVGRRVIDEEDIYEKHGVYPDMWADIKAIAGCDSDGVPGVPGVGINRAANYLLGKMKPSSKMYQLIESSDKVIILTRRLTTLPFDGTPTYELLEDKCKVKNLKSVAKEYGLGSYLTRERLKQFRRYFCHVKKKKITANRK